MKVKELIEELEKFDGELEVYDSSGFEVEGVKEDTWTHDNYPYNLPDKQIVKIL